MRKLSPLETELDRLATAAGQRVLEAYLGQHGVPIYLDSLVRAALVTGMDMGMAFAVEFPAAARTVIGAVSRGAGLTEADRGQRKLLFVDLVVAARAEP